jgi:hypothetical protein
VSPCHLVSLSPSFLVSLILSLSLGIAAAQAHGGGRAQLVNVPAGPYHLFVWTSPDPWRVGQAHTTVAVTQPLGDGQEMPVTGVQVAVTYAPRGGPGETVSAIEQGGVQPGFYEADAQVTQPGDWVITVAVDGAAGQGETSFTYAVLPPDGPNWVLAGSGVLAGVLFLTALVFVMRRRAPRRQAHRQGATRS